MSLIEKMSQHIGWDGDVVYDPKIEDMLGLVFTDVTQSVDELRFKCAEGTFIFFHDQDCCESVEIESVVGDLQDLVGEPLLLAEESNGETPVGYTFEYEPDSYTWTFYKFATRKGYVDVRWLGESNGYYGERVDLKFEVAA
jgi:hypothetical protein